MASTLTRRGGEVTIRALSMGAADYAPKPRIIGDDCLRSAACRCPACIQSWQAIDVRPEAALTPEVVAEQRTLAAWERPLSNTTDWVTQRSCAAGAGGGGGAGQAPRGTCQATRSTQKRKS